MLQPNISQAPSLQSASDLELSISDLKNELDIVKLLILSRHLDGQYYKKVQYLALQDNSTVCDILLTQNCISADAVHTACLVLLLVRKSYLSYEQAVLCLSRYNTANLNIVTIVSELKGDDSRLVRVLGISALLIAAGIVGCESYSRAAECASFSNMPMGKTLFALRLITLPCLDSAIYLAGRVACGELTLELAAKILRRAAATNTYACELARESRGVNASLAKEPMLGGILVEAGALKSSELVESLEVSLFQEKPLGEILVARGVIARDLLEGALKVQRMIVCGMLKLREGIECIRAGKIASTGAVEIVRRASLLVPCRESLSELARKADFLKYERDVRTKQFQAVSGLDALEAQFLACDLPYELYRALVRASELLEEKAIDEAQALQALERCQRLHCTFDAALAGMGVKIYAAQEISLAEAPVIHNKFNFDMLNSGVICQIAAGMCLALVVVILLPSMVANEYRWLGQAVVLGIYWLYVATIIYEARRVHNEQIYEKEVSVEAAINTRNKLKSLRVGARGAQGALAE
jgi:hypothetical protein